MRGVITFRTFVLAIVFGGTVFLCFWQYHASHRRRPIIDTTAGFARRDVLQLFHAFIEHLQEDAQVDTSLISVNDDFQTPAVIAWQNTNNMAFFPAQKGDVDLKLLYSRLSQSKEPPLLFQERSDWLKSKAFTDSWRHEMHIKYQLMNSLRSGQLTLTNYLVTVYSNGENQRDDLGKGDDIALKFNFYSVVKSQ